MESNQAQQEQMQQLTARQEAEASFYKKMQILDKIAEGITRLQPIEDQDLTELTDKYVKLLLSL